jgi:cell division protein FtsI/penicillin-binding protein 2
MMDNPASSTGRYWLIVCAVGLLLAFSGLGYRLVDLQVRQHDQLRDTARGNTTRTIIIQPRRGDIFDSNGNKLATSRFVKTVCADPVMIGHHYPAVARALASVLGMDVRALEARLKPRLIRTPSGAVKPNRYVRLKRKVLPEVFEEVKKVMAGFPIDDPTVAVNKEKQQFVRNMRRLAVFADREEDQLRLYPSSKLAAHILGFVGGDDHAGKEGIEKVLQSQLTGARGWRIIEIDKGKRERVERRVQDVAARNGLNAYLTIDLGIQNIVEQELALAMEKHRAAGVTAIVVRPRSGNVLAMANLPTFDPRHPGDFDASARRNRAVTDTFEPGSTFKAVTVAGALNEGLVTLRTQFHCSNGRLFYAGKILHDHHSYGLLTVEKIITKSSNIGAAKVGMRLGAPRLHQYIRDFGFGSRTGISLPGEVVGIVHPLKEWSKLSISRVPMGHEVAGTPLQVVMMMSAIANGGRLMQPRVVDRLEDEQGRLVLKYPVKTVRQVISPTAAKQVTKALKTVVAQGGTARRAELDYYTAAGKTGTAQKPGRGGYIPGKYYASFVGFLPADKPELCILVAVDEPQGEHYGGLVAAPVFKAIAGRTASYLGIVPDKEPDKLAITDGRAPGRR